ncbi:SPOR domain-containing protein [Paenibacillus sp. BR2-3]|uniref:SPOR domain-containing protein n=1 Tax=Paenibacillus sp. BR2-3 TaxID=3048494 RepID=UPI0039775F61
MRQGEVYGVNNGRMTFRFDIEEDKRKKEERWPGSGLRIAKEYGPEVQPSENQSSDVRPHLYPELWGDAPPVLPLDEEEDSWYRNRQSDHTRERYMDEESSVPNELYSGTHHSRRPSYWWKFAASVTAAVGIGILFGYAALSFFRGGDLPDTAVTETSNIAVAGEQSVGVALDPAGSGTSGLSINGNDTGNPLQKISVQVAGQSYFLLQYGVFSTSDGASQAQQELLTAGLAAGLDPADGNRVYAGISPDREQAKLLSNGLKSQGIELYVRQVDLPAAEELAFGGTAETVNHYFEVSGRLLGELSSLTASLLNNGSTAPTSDVSNLHLEWTEAVKALQSGLPPAALSIIAEQEKSISQGISALNEYNKNKSDGLLWEVQGSMMAYLTGQKKLLAALT